MSDTDSPPPSPGGDDVPPRPPREEKRSFRYEDDAPPPRRGFQSGPPPRDRRDFSGPRPPFRDDRRRDDRRRDDRPPSRPWQERPPRRAFDDRGPRPPRDAGGPPRPWENRPPRDFDRPRPPRPWENQPPRQWGGDRPPRRDFDDRGPRQWQDRPPRREFDDRGPRQWQERPPRRDFDDRGPRQWQDRPPRRDFDDRGPRQWQDRPPRRDFSRDERPAREKRPPRPLNAREIALQILGNWNTGGSYADALLAEWDQRVQLSRSDRALLHALVLGVLRHKKILDVWIAELNERGELSPVVEWCLRLGLFQLLKLGVAEHAAVNETVDLAPEGRTLVNAILRRAIDEKEHLLAIEEDAPLHEKHSLPDFLVERWRWLFGEEGLRKLLGLIDEPAEVFVRLNRLKPWPEPPAGAEPVEGVPDFFRVPELPREALDAGHCYVQDPATWFAPAMLDVKPGHTVLDACAAPGGKSAILAQFMENSGRLVASDNSARRLRRLQENLQRLGVTCFETPVLDWTQPDLPDDGVRYDRILLDVPCSNTGVIRRRVDVRWRVTHQSVAEMVDVQWRILKNAIPRLLPGGRLVYSTCSLEPAENDKQVERILAEYPFLKLEQSKLITPHETGFDGAFAACFYRTSEEA